LYWGLQRIRCDSILPIWPYIRKRLRSLRIGLGHQYGCGRISLEDQYGGRDVLSKYWLPWLVVFKLRSSNPCRSFSCDNSEFTQQDDRKKRTSERLCVTDVTGLLRMRFVVTLTELMFSGLLKQDLFKGGWSSAEEFFFLNFCHACHSRFAFFFPLPSSCLSSLSWDLSPVRPIR